MIIEFEKRRSTEIAFKVNIRDEYASKTPAEQRGAAIVKALSKKKDLSGSDLSYSNISGSDSSYCELSGCDLSYSDLSYCDLRGSDISYSDLSGADLRGCDLRDSDLSGCDLSGCGLSVLLTDIWTAYIHKEHIRIGCQYHKALEWFTFTDDEISRMNVAALVWWKQWKPAIQAAHAVLLQGEPA